MNIHLPWIEIVGYLGSLLIAVSLMMNSIRRLRWVNLFGASTFAAYGLLVQAYPVFALNSFISLVDIFYLAQMRRKRDFFELFEIDPMQSPFLKRFLSFYAKDIERFFPDFNGNIGPHFKVIFILRNLMPVGLFIIEPLKEGTWQIHLDYVIPPYRDFQTAHYLYHREHELFQQHIFDRFVIRTTVDAHIKYLKRLGFKKDRALGEDWYAISVK